MSRTRLIRPEFFADETLAGVSDSVRLFYIGLWTLCDDAGYFEHRPRQIAAALYPYQGPGRRERTTTEALAKLIGLARVRILDCGIHGTVPTLPRHGAKGGTKSETYASRHRTTCLSVHAPTLVRTPDVRTSSDESSSVSGSGSGSESVSESAGAHAKRRAMAAAGGFAATLVGHRE